VRDIAKAAGASIGSVNYYFKTKKELLLVAVAQSDQRFRASVREAVAVQEGAVAKLERIAGLSFLDEGDVSPDWAVFVDFWQQASREVEFRAIFESANEEWLELLVDVMTDGVAAGELEIRGDVRDAAMALAALIDGLGLHTRVTQHIDATTAHSLVIAYIEGLRVQ
jgi:AcrR family transcriptional regulator